MDLMASQDWCRKSSVAIEIESSDCSAHSEFLYPRHEGVEGA